MFRQRMAVLAALLAIASTAIAQRPQRQPTPNDTLKSPEVSDDHKVTFRIYAPKASAVSVGGDFGAPATLTKDDKGVWSVTVGPLTPDYYSYSFIVDSVRTLDPKNPTIKQGISTLENMMSVPGKESEFQENQKVPHGEIRKVWYNSSTLKEQRRMHVYTPPGYDASSDKYPVFYLLHGGGDEDSGWSTIGRAGFILDNLIAGQKAKPMLVVMPNGSMPRPANPGRVAPGQQPPADFAKRMAEFQQLFTDELLKDVIPTVEKNFRAKTGAENRALAGLSMGGGQTLTAVSSNPDQFAYIGIWSAGIFGNADEWEKSRATFLDSADKLNKNIKRFDITVGDKDFVLASSKNLDEILKKHGIKHEMRLTEGGHTWINWRHYLNDFAPHLFQ
jgi:enterochelin esterase family protein